MHLKMRRSTVWKFPETETNVGISDCPIGTCANGSEADLNDLEEKADGLECRIEDMKCAALDVKAILDESRAHFDKLSNDIEGLKSKNKE